MVEYNLPGDPYNQQDLDLDEEPFEDSESSGIDTELQVYNPRERPLRQDEAESIPEWGQYINHWSRQDGQRLLYGMAKGFYNVSRGWIADRDLQVIVNWIARQADQGRISINRVLQVNTVAQVNTVDILRLDEMQDETQHHTEALQRQVNAALIWEHQAAQERRWKAQDEAGPKNCRINRHK